MRGGQNAQRVAAGGWNSSSHLDRVTGKAVSQGHATISPSPGLHLVHAAAVGGFQCLPSWPRPTHHRLLRCAPWISLFAQKQSSTRSFWLLLISAKQTRKENHRGSHQE